jgi:hypothetical protein
MMRFICREFATDCKNVFSHIGHNSAKNIYSTTQKNTQRHIEEEKRVDFNQVAVEKPLQWHVFTCPNQEHKLILSKLLLISGYKACGNKASGYLILAMVTKSR